MVKSLFSKKNLLVAGLVLLVLAIGCGGWYWWTLQPKSYSLTDTEVVDAKINLVDGPAVTSVFADGSIGPSAVFVYFDKPVIKPEYIGKSFDEKLVSLSPHTVGRWYASTDHSIMFTPTGDWVAGTSFKGKVKKELISDNVNLTEDSFEFLAPLYRGSVASKEFYENPTDLKSKHAIATFKFTYPIETKDLEDKISIYSNSGEKYGFTHKLEHANRTLHIMSDPVKIKAETDFVHIEIKDLANAYNSVTINQPVEAEVTIPSLSNFFTLNSITTQIVNNEKKNNNPEQILFVNFSTAVNPAVLDDYLKVYAFNGGCYDIRRKYADAKEDFGRIMNHLTPVALEHAGTDTELSKLHTYRYDIREPNVCLAIQVQKGLSSAEDYQLLIDQTTFVESAIYPKEAKIAFEGSLIPLKNEKALSFVSRGVDKLKVKIARIRAEELNHLITQTYGSFSNPEFRNYNFNEDNIAEVFEKDIAINMTNPAKEDYSSLDLSSYFEGKKGIFLVRMSGQYKGGYTTSQDSRLVVITDLGLIAKDNADGTHSLFVANLTDGRPIYGVKIDILGKNGLPVLSVKTDDDGYASVPDYRSFRNDKEVVAYKLSYGKDISYMPIRTDKLDVSRFDTGGIYEGYGNKDEVAGYVFTDRGIYRPNEDAHFGIIVRHKDLGVPENLPMRLDIANSQGDKVATKNVWPDKTGLIEYSYHVPANAPLGSYAISVYRLGSDNRASYVTSTSFKVEEFAPDTMRIKLDLLDDVPAGWYTDTELSAKVDLQNLYGNPAAGHTVKTGYSLNASSFSFAKYKGYYFNDPVTRSLSGTYDYLPDVTTDENGKAELKVNWSNYIGTYRLTVSATGLELDSGRGVSASSSILVSPAKFLVGYKADGQTGYLNKLAERKINYVAVDNKLEQIEQSGLKLKLFKKEYSTNLVAMPNGTYRYQTVAKDVLVSENDFVIPAGGVDYMLDTKNPGEYSVVISDSAGKLSGLNYTVAGSENTSYALDKDASLEIKLDKTEYEAGDDIKMQIKAPYEGYGLITIERDKVYAHKWFEAKTNSVTQEIQIPRNLEGNAYVNVAWVRDIGSKEILMSPLSYGVVPFSINKASRSLNIELNVPTVVKPGDDLVINYKTDDDAHILLYGVNTGILQVANYQMPNPLDQFMKKRALRVATSQIMDLILPDLKVARFLKGVGGDMEQKAEENMRVNPFARKQQKPVAFWSGILKSDDSEQTYTYTVPDNFNGEIKVMAVGVSDEKLGHGSTSLNVRGDFTMVPSGPFNVSPDDGFVVSVSVADMVETDVEAVPVEVRLHVGKGVRIVGEDAKMADLKFGQETSVMFTLKATDEKLGSVPLVFRAVNQKDETKASQISYELGIRPSNAYITDLNMGFETSKLTLENFVKPMFAEYRNQSITASTSPMVLATGLISFLDKFPHECTEQSVSKILPAIEVFFKYPELLEGIDVYKIYDNVIVRLTERQTIDGGFKSWSSSWSSVSEFDSLYATEFLISAKKHDFNVPQNMYKKALQYARTVAGREMKSFDDANPAYAAYLLTLSGEMTSNYLIKIEEYLATDLNTSRKSLSALYLAAGYQLLQNETKARQYVGYYKTGDDDVANARYIYLMSTHFSEDFRALSKEGMEALLKPLKNADFTTISAAYSLLALNSIGGDEGDDESITFNGKPSESETFAVIPLNSGMKELLIEAPEPFYYVVSQQGFMQNPVTKAESKGIELYKEYLDKNGNDITSAKLGDEITVKITARYTKGDYINDVAIVDMIPGCLEIVRDSIAGTSFDYNEVREDRALMYLSLGDSTKTIKYRAKVIAKGEFVVPATFADALYDPSIRANTKASEFEVLE